MHYLRWNGSELWGVMYLTRWGSEAEMCKQPEVNERERWLNLRKALSYICVIMFMNVSTALVCFYSLLMHILCCLFLYLHRIFISLCFQTSACLIRSVQTLFNNMFMKFKWSPCLCNKLELQYGAGACRYMTMFRCLQRNIDEPIYHVKNTATLQLQQHWGNSCWRT